MNKETLYSSDPAPPAPGKPTSTASLCSPDVNICFPTAPFGCRQPPHTQPRCVQTTPNVPSHDAQAAQAKNLENNERTHSLLFFLHFISSLSTNPIILPSNYTSNSATSHYYLAGVTVFLLVHCKDPYGSHHILRLLISHPYQSIAPQM